ATAGTLASPRAAKGPSQARITGPWLVHAIVVSGDGEPGQQGGLAMLAGLTGLFTVLFGLDAGVPTPVPTQLSTPPPKASLGARYIVIYTVPGVTPQPGEQFGQVRQDLYPGAVGGPVIYTPPSQDGFGQPLQDPGGLRPSPQLTRILPQLGVRPRPPPQAAPPTRLPLAAHPAPAHQAGSRTLAWLIASAIAVAVLACTALWLRHRKSAAMHDSKPRTSGPAAGSV